MRLAIAEITKNEEKTNRFPVVQGEKLCYTKVKLKQQGEDRDERRKGYLPDRSGTGVTGDV